MHAVILAGGKGTRLKPYTTVFPKPLMPVGGMPILEILIRQLKAQGFLSVTLTVGHLAKLIESYFGDGATFGLKIEYSHENEPLGTMGPLKLIQNLPENFLVINGDILSDVNYAEFLSAHQKRRSIFSISAYKREINSEFGVLEISSENTLIGFREKPKIPFLVSMGIYGVNCHILEEIPQGKTFGFDQLMLRLLEKKNPPQVVQHEGYWLDIGRAEDYDLAQDAFDKMKDRLLPREEK